MADQYAVIVEGFELVGEIEKVPKKVIDSARIAVNEAARSGYAQAGREITRQVAFPARYVTGKSGRMQISQFASNKNLEAKITARSRPTSLARFTRGSVRIGGRAGVRVEVKPGSVVRLPGAFLIKLRAGSASIDTQHNVGVAVRTKNGRPPPGYKPLPIGKNLWLLYGPSVAQVLYSERNRGGVATQISPDIEKKLEAEFWRQMEL